MVGLGSDQPECGSGDQVRLGVERVVDGIDELADVVAGLSAGDRDAENSVFATSDIANADCCSRLDDRRIGSRSGQSSQWPDSAYNRRDIHIGPGLSKWIILQNLLEKNLSIQAYLQCK